MTDFLQNIKEVPGSVIFYHTHRFLVQHQFLSPEPPNDFAYWVNSALQDEILAEKLAAIDTVRYRTIRDLRDKIVLTIEGHLAKHPSEKVAPAGDEFHFMRSLSFIIPTPYEAWDLNGFVAGLKKISIYSLYHHIFVAKLRLESGTNDFSRWLGESLGEEELAKAISKLDPYTQTLEGLRHRIIDLSERRIRSLSRTQA